MPASRSISGVKVDATTANASHPRVRIEWTNGAGNRRFVERWESAEREILIDLHACTVIGDANRTAYLIGLIRGFTLVMVD